MKKLRWGVLSTAKIGVEKVIPAMQRGQYCDVVAIASRQSANAERWAKQLGIARAYGSYEALLGDPDVDAVYNPLPNHLHVPWSISALQAGKHVLCEKPIGLSVDDARRLLGAAGAHPDLKIMEAFMYRFHPQWQLCKQLVDDGALGEVRTIQTFFSYFNDDPDNIRNMKDIGGGGLMDIGCYPISQARFLLGQEPSRVHAALDIDPRFGTDRVATATLEFADASASFVCATQLWPHQRAAVVGTRGRIEIEIPVSAPPDKTTRIWIDDSDGRREAAFAPCDQYTLQGDVFSAAVLNDDVTPTPLSDALANMAVIDALIASHRSNRWIDLA